MANEKGKGPIGRPSKFSPEACASVVARLEVGQTIRQATEAAGLKYPTVQGWIARGRRERDEGKGGAYVDFAVAVEEATNRPKIEPMTPEEHRAKVSEVARGGNVQALKLMWEMILADRNPDEEAEEEADPLQGVDELAARRTA